MDAAHDHSAGHAPVKLEYQPGLPLTNAKLIIWLFLSTEIMFFAALIGVYIVIRFGAPIWPRPHDVHLVEEIGAFNTFVLICSSVTIVLAFEAAKANKAAAAKMWMILTLALGSVFLGVKAVEYSAKFSHGIYPVGPVNGGVDRLKQGSATVHSRIYERTDLYYGSALRRSVESFITKYNRKKDPAAAAAKEAAAAAAAAGKAPATDEAKDAAKDEAKAKTDKPAEKAEPPTAEEEKAFAAFNKPRAWSDGGKEMSIVERLNLHDLDTAKLAEVAQLITPRHDSAEAASETSDYAEHENLNEQFPWIGLTLFIAGGNVWARTYFRLHGVRPLALIYTLTVFALMMD